MNIQFTDFDHAVRSLPDTHENPLWNGSIVDYWRELMNSFRPTFGVVDQYMNDLEAGEVGLIDGLPYVQQASAYMGVPSSWMVDGIYCASLQYDRATLDYALGKAANRWKTVSDVPALFGVDGDLKTKICHFDRPHKSKQRNEQKQALALHEGWTLTEVAKAPTDFMISAFDYWHGQGSSCESSCAAYCWTVACVRFNEGKMFHFVSPLGEAYVGIVNIGGQWVFNVFFQGAARPNRMGTAALTAVVDWYRANDTSGRFLYLDAPRFGEDMSYAVYKSHLANDEAKVGSLYAYYPKTLGQPTYCAEAFAWIS